MLSIVLVVHYLGAAQSIRYISALAAELARSNLRDVRLVMVPNAVKWERHDFDQLAKFSAAPPSPISECAIVPGSNRLWEFSGYLEGAQHLGVDSGSPTLFLNDTFFFKHPHRIYLTRFIRFLTIASTYRAPVIMGRLDEFPVGSAPGANLDGYISSFAFLTNAAATGLLVNDWSEYLQRSVEAPLRLEGFEELTLAEQDWIRWGVSPQGLWVPTNVNAVDESFLQEKMRSVALEYLASRRVLSNGGVLFDLFPTVSERLKTIVLYKWIEICRKVRARFVRSA